MNMRPIRDILWERQAGRCCYCDKLMVRYAGMHPKKQAGEIWSQRATLEHLRDRNKGGGTGADNKALACNECNCEKNHGGFDWLTFKSLKMGEITDERI